MGRLRFSAKIFGRFFVVLAGVLAGLNSQTVFGQTYYHTGCEVFVAKGESRINNPKAEAALARKGYAINYTNVDLKNVYDHPMMIPDSSMALILSVNEKSDPVWVKATGGPFCTASLMARRGRSLNSLVFAPSNSCNALQLIRQLPVCKISQDEHLLNSQPSFKATGSSYIQGGSWLSHLSSWATKWIKFKIYYEGDRIYWNPGFASHGRGSWVWKNGSQTGIIFRRR